MTKILRMFWQGATGLPLALAAPVRFGRGGVRYTMTVLVPAVIAFAATTLSVFVCYSGYLYPIRQDAFPAITHPFTADPIFDASWGGPALVGAWLVHSLVALGMQVIALQLIKACVRWQHRAGARLLGSMA